MTSYIEFEMNEEMRLMEQRMNEMRLQMETIRIERQNYQLRVEEVDDLINSKINEENETVTIQTKKVKNLIITGPTQAGKTARVIQACVAEKNTKKFITISCDNLTAQLNQMLARFVGRDIPVFTLKSINFTQVEEHLKNNRSVVVIILNNDKQIIKLDNFLSELVFYQTPSDYLFFHDEGDMVNKADTLEDLTSKTIAKSHLRWVSLIDKLQKSQVQTTRVFVTATPENCSFISDIKLKDIIVLPIDTNYRNISQHIVWDKTNLQPIGVEVERIRQAVSREAILYSVEKKNGDQEETAKMFSSRFNCVALTFNMQGFRVYQNGSPFRHPSIQIQQSDSISLVFQKLRDVGPVIVVGYNLMNRGISFVGSELNQEVRTRSLTATTMFVEMGDKSHVVGTTQRLGRGCGTSRPEITRRVVYCSQKMYDDYKNYLKNQRTVFSKLSNPHFSNKTISEILNESPEAEKLQNKLDRPTLKNVNANYSDSCSSPSDGEPMEFDEDKMKRLINNWRVEGSSGRVGLLFRAMISDNGTMENRRVRETIGENQYGALAFEGHSNQWSLIFRKDNTNHYIREEALDYYNGL